MKEPLLLIGGGGHCKSCIDVIEQENRFQIAGIIDLPDKIHQNVLGYPIIGNDGNLPELIPTYPNILITIGQIKSARQREQLFNTAKRLGAVFPVIKSPLAYVSTHAEINEGTIIMHHALINAGARVGRNCIINTKALVEHDATIGDHCHIATGALVNGGVVVGSGSFWGSGAVSKEYTSIPRNSFLKANSVIREAP